MSVGLRSDQIPVVDITVRQTPVIGLRFDLSRIHRLQLRAFNQLPTGFDVTQRTTGRQNNVACRQIAKNDPQPFSETVGEFGDDRIVAR